MMFHLLLLDFSHLQHTFSEMLIPQYSQILIEQLNLLELLMIPLQLVHTLILQQLLCKQGYTDDDIRG